jgi:hypothetical protein
MFVLSQIYGCSLLAHPLRSLLPTVANSDWGWDSALARILPDARLRQSAGLLRLKLKAKRQQGLNTGERIALRVRRVLPQRILPPLHIFKGD